MAIRAPWLRRIEGEGVQTQAQVLVTVLMRLKTEHGDLNRALVRLFVEAYGEASVASLARDVGLSRSVVRRAIQDLSENDR